MKRSKPSKLRKPAGKRRRATPLLSAVERHQSALRWRELTGERLRAQAPRTLALSLGTMQSMPVRGRKLALRAIVPEVKVFIRATEGEGCERKAEIAGWYSNHLRGLPCIGQKAVLQILNDAAERLCRRSLDCPSRCPCSYVPRQKLGTYRCTKAIEVGYLLQGDRVWNCFCFEE